MSEEQVAIEDSEARIIRREWMALIGFNAAEIDEACESSCELDLSEELAQLGAAIRLAR